MGVNSLPKTVTRQRGGCDLNPGPSAPESSTQTTRLPSHPYSCRSAIYMYPLTRENDDMLRYRVVFRPLLQAGALSDSD